MSLTIRDPGKSECIRVESYTIDYNVDEVEELLHNQHGLLWSNNENKLWANLKNAPGLPGILNLFSEDGDSRRSRALDPKLKRMTRIFGFARKQTYNHENCDTEDYWTDVLENYYASYQSEPRLIDWGDLRKLCLTILEARRNCFKNRVREMEHSQNSGIEDPRSDFVEEVHRMDLALTNDAGVMYFKKSLKSRFG